jgi:hypothetical protein
MAYNPYSAYARRGEALDERTALLDALDEPAAPPHTRTPARPPQQTREMLEGPGGRTSYMDPNEAAGIGRDIVNAGPTTDVGGNPFSGDRWGDERQEPVYQPPSTTGTPQTQPSHVYNPQTGTELVDAYDDPYQRRGGYGGMEPTRKKISEGLLSSGEPYTMVSGAFGMLDSYMRRRAESAPTDFNIADARNIISQAHKDAFGTDIAPEYLDQIVRGQGWEDGDRYFGDASMRYVLDQFDQQSGGALSRSRTETEAPPATSAPSTTATPGATGQPPYAMEGFDLQRAQDPSFSVKDAFAAAVRQAGEPPPGEDKAALGEWFKKYAQPFIEAQGHKVNWVEGDKVNITGPQGTGTTDWYRGAGAAGGALAWQPEDGGGGGGAAGDAPSEIAGAYEYLKSIAHPGMSRADMESAVAKAFGNVPGFEKAYAGDVVINGKKIDLITNFEGPGAAWSDNLSFVPLHGGGSANAGGGAGLIAGSGLNLAPNVQLAAPLQRSDANAQIMAELQRLLSGQPPRDELLEALG